MITAKQFSKSFASLTLDQQILFLARLASGLTVHARGTYEPGTARLTKPEQMREFNEFQHRVTSQLLSVLTDRHDRYPDDVFADIVWDCAIATGSQAAVVDALDKSLASGAKNKASVA